MSCMGISVQNITEDSILFTQINGKAASYSPLTFQYIHLPIFKPCCSYSFIYTPC